HDIRLAVAIEIMKQPWYDRVTQIDPGEAQRIRGRACVLQQPETAREWFFSGTDRDHDICPSIVIHVAGCNERFEVQRGHRSRELPEPGRCRARLVTEE